MLNSIGNFDQTEEQQQEQQDELGLTSPIMLPFMLIFYMYEEHRLSTTGPIEKLLREHPVYGLYIAMEILFATCYLFLCFTTIIAFFGEIDYSGSWELLAFNLILSSLSAIACINTIVSLVVSVLVFVIYWNILFCPGWLPADIYSTMIYACCVDVFKLFLMSMMIPIFVSISLMSNAVQRISISVGGYDSTITDYLLFVLCLVSCCIVFENINGVLESSQVQESSKEASIQSITSSVRSIDITCTIVFTGGYIYASYMVAKVIMKLRAVLLRSLWCRTTKSYFVIGSNTFDADNGVSTLQKVNFFYLSPSTMPYQEL